MPVGAETVAVNDRLSSTISPTTTPFATVPVIVRGCVAAATGGVSEAPADPSDAGRELVPLVLNVPFRLMMNRATIASPLAANRVTKIPRRLSEEIITANVSEPIVAM